MGGPGVAGFGLVVWRAARPDGWRLRRDWGGFEASRPFSGRLTPARYPVGATARARIGQFTEANSTHRVQERFPLGIPSPVGVLKIGERRLLYAHTPSSRKPSLATTHVAT